MAIAALFAALGCRGVTGTKEGERPDGSAPSQPPDAASPRAAAVLSADRLELDAERAGGQGDAAVRGLIEAARLRQLVYRRERRRLDGLGAVETLRAIEAHPNAVCAGLGRALLEGELERDPSRAYRDAYAFHVATTSSECRARAARALIALSAYRPSTAVLAELERAARARAGLAAPSPPAGPPSAGSSRSSASAPSQPPRITRVERYAAADAARIVVHSGARAPYRVGKLPGPEPRLFVDMEGASFAGPSSYDVGGLVERVRLGKSERGTRLVLDLAEPAEHRSFYLPEPSRLVIDVSTPRAAASEVAARRIRRVVLDPGHGGRDPGAVGPGGLYEKDVTLDIAHRAAPILARELGVTALLTRDGDQYVSLDERTARGNAFHADLFVSIHCNATEDGAGKAVMTFVLDHSREELSSRIAARENAASEAAAREMVDALRALADPAHQLASARFADVLQRATLASLARSYGDVPDGGVRQAGFYVLAGARMPAVLLEASFISNLAGETRLNTEDFRQKVADGIANAVRAYRDGL